MAFKLTGRRGLGLALNERPREVEFEATEGQLGVIGQCVAYSIHLPCIWCMTSIASRWLAMRTKPRRRPIPSSCERRMECSTSPKGVNSALNSTLDCQQVRELEFDILSEVERKVENVEVAGE